MQDADTAGPKAWRSSRHLLARSYQAIAAGALGGLCQSLVLWVFIEAGAPLLLGLVLSQPPPLPWLYQRTVWGGLWGLLFLLPLFPHWAGWKRGLLLGLVPAAASLFYFLPFQDGHGVMGLELGYGMPVMVVGFGLLWGIITGFWYQRALPARPVGEGGAPAAGFGRGAK